MAGMYSVSLARSPEKRTVNRTFARFVLPTAPGKVLFLEPNFRSHDDVINKG